MADSGKDPNETNNSQNVTANHAQIVVVGSAIVNMPGTPGGHGEEQPQPSKPNLNTSVTDAPPSYSAEDVQNVANRVSMFLRDDYLTSYDKANPNSLDVGQTPLKLFFVKRDFRALDNCCQKGQLDLMYRIFEGCNDSTPPERVLLYGNAGEGKTLLCQKYIYDWANNIFPADGPFSQFKIVILLKLCEVEGTLAQIFEREVFCGRLTTDEKAEFMSYMTKNSSKFLFVLDGVDECDLHKVEDIQNLLFGKILKGVRVIATMCPSNSCFDVSKTFQSRYHIVNFSESKVMEYVSKYFRLDVEKGDALIERMNDSPNLKQLGQIPLIALTICELWKTWDTLPTTTDVLGHYTEFVLRLFTSMKSRKEEISQDVLSCFGELAALGLMEDRTNFSQNDLAACMVDDLRCKVGFLCFDPEKKTYKFSHEKIQQYFAAKWIVDNWNSQKANDRLKTILHDLEISRFWAVLVFISGLLSKQKDCNKWLEFFEKIATSIGQTLTEFIQDSCYGRTMDLFLSCVFEASTIEGKERSVNEEILHLFEGFEPFKKAKTPYGIYVLPMSHSAAKGLAIVVSELRLARLNLSCIGVSFPQAKILARNCLRNNSSLKSVKFSHSCLCPNGVKVVCVAFLTMVRLEEVDLTCCNLGGVGLKAIADLVRSDKAGITSLQLGNYLDENFLQKEQSTNESPSKHDHSIARQISKKNLEDLSKFQEECRETPPTEEAKKELISAIVEEDGLEDISLPSCCVDKLIHEWLEVFKKSTQLKRIK